ncbi:AEC family transporter [Acidovorax carolinensis]|uniref:Transporter n=1 Tax=Acidovorax carolinensis TaxID=553814 RepID=A0A240UC47_9BURK|nr:AEC family transporter [Acidovorax carolinensis]ART48401.1 transporter [Acidovorax carolinensis]ART55161.1 transporter [Acidovorax carolinensis]ART59067.1 transporter [Acidovorax carolinensis]
MNSPVFASLVPVILFIALGFFVGRRGWIRATSVKDLSNLVFMVLTPALLFRTMSTVRVQDLDFGPVAVYFAAAGLIFAATLVVQGFGSLAAARGLANTFSNTIMIGVPLVGLVFGQAGLVTLFTLISVHSLILLTAATVVFELAQARERARSGEGPQHSMLRTVLQAIGSGIVHPVPLPIIVGLLFAQTGLVVPDVIGKPLQLLGQALGPLALLLVGVTLAFSTVGTHFKAALRIALVKNIVHPLLLGALGWALGLSGLSLAVMVATAALPVGANVFLFAQRYGVAQDEVTASIAVSTTLALVTVPVALLLAARL